MERGEPTRSPRPRRSPPAPAPRPGIGTIEVTVKHRSLCWDSVASGESQLHPGATVTLRPPSGGPRTATSDANGLARFENVPSGAFTVEATATNYSTSSVSGTLAPGGTERPTIEIDLQVGLGVICTRQHTPRPSGSPTISDLPPMFWHDNVMIWIREVAWLLFMVLMVVFLVIAIANAAIPLRWNPGIGGFALPVVCFAVVAYLTAIIFGELAGIITMVLAGLAWLALIGITIATAAGVPGLLPLDFVWFPVLCGMWTSFFVFLPIRMSYRIEHDWPYLFLFPIPAIVVGMVLFLVMVYVPEPNLLTDGGVVALCTILCVVFCFVFGLVGGLTGHVFKNDGAVEPYTVHAKLSLPFAGTRYCVQGNRGWFSHYASSTQERCYDFAVPPGTHVLAIQEGHVIRFHDDKDGSAYDGSGNNDANYIYVEHQDGSRAHYLHLQKDGISSINPVLVANSWGPAELRFCDVHVHAGQLLALAGSTGISRFPHIHLGLYGGPGGGTELGLEFKDADVQRHGGRCFTFRKYQSDNVDHGPAQI